jgi:hypothetical protein
MGGKLGGGRPVAGQAPEFLPPDSRIEHWLERVSDLRISLYMLVGAAAIFSFLYVLDQRVFN